MSDKTEFWMSRCLAIEEALCQAPKMPEPKTLHIMGTMRIPHECSEIGNRIQRELGLDAVPPVSECERGAGFWDMLTSGAWRDADEHN